MRNVCTLAAVNKTVESPEKIGRSPEPCFFGRAAECCYYYYYYSCLDAGGGVRDVFTSSCPFTGGTTWHRGVRSAAGRPDRVTPNAVPHHGPTATAATTSLYYTRYYISYPPRAAHTSRAGLAPCLYPPPRPGHHHSSGPHATTRHVVPARPPLLHPSSWRVRRLTFLCPLGCACACVCGRRRRRRTTHTRTVGGRCVRRGGVQTAPRCLPFRDPPPDGAIPLPDTAASSPGVSVGRSVGRRRKPERSHIFRYSAVLYYLYIILYIYIFI